MSKTALIVGFGPGVSTAMAEKFGGEGFAIGLVARSEDKLKAGVEALAAKGIQAAAIPADASDPASIRAAVAKARAEVGPIGVLHWNAYGGAGLGPLTTADPARMRGIFDVALVGLVSAVQEALPDLEAAGDGAVLVTNGAFGELNPAVDAFAVSLGDVALPLANAAKAKLVGLLSATLKPKGVYVGEVTIAGAVKGTGWAADGVASIEGSAIADAFWRLYEARDAIRARIG